MKSKVPEYIDLPHKVRMTEFPLEKVCPILAEIENFFRKWSPESYDGYYFGCALSLVSIISARRVQYYRDGPCPTNFYIVLVGETGLSAKTTVMNLVKVVLRNLELEYLLIPDTITAQKLFSEMCLKIPEDFQKGENSVKRDVEKQMQDTQAFVGQKGWIYDEMGDLYREMMQNGHHNSSFRGLLKRLEDNPTSLGIGTQKRGKEISYYPFLTLLGAMTPADLSPFAKKGTALWHDGSLGRIVFISAPDDFRKDCPFPNEERIVPLVILEGLSEWNIRLGRPQIKLVPEVQVIEAPGELFKLSDEVKKASYQYRSALKDMIERWKAQGESNDLAGNYIRLPDLALRIATIVASVNGEREITLKHWAFAQNKTEQWRKELHWLYSNALANSNMLQSFPYQDPKEKVLELIIVKGPLTSREIQQFSHFKKASVESLLAVLVKEGEITKIESGKTFKYIEKTGEIDV